MERERRQADVVPLYEVTEGGLVARPAASFADLGLSLKVAGCGVALDRHLGMVGWAASDR